MSFLPVCTEQPFVMAIIGRRGSGKGHLCIDLLKHFYKGMFDFIVWISPTFQLQAMTLNLEDHTGVVVFSQWRPKIITSLYQYMYSRNSGDREGREKEHCLLILDDVGLQAKKGKLSDQLDQIAFTSRHYGVSLIEMTQRITSLSTSVRSQLDALIMFREENPLERQNLYRNFGFGENKKDWFRIIDSKTEEKFSVIGIRNFAGHFVFFDLNGDHVETPSLRSGTTRASAPSDHRVQRVRDRERYQDDLRRLQQPDEHPRPPSTLSQRVPGSRTSSPSYESD